MKSYLTIVELAKILGMKPSWVRSRIFKKQIPHLKISGQIRFEAEEIQAWVDQQKVTNDQIVELRGSYEC